jgi:hypothetical protein
MRMQAKLVDFFQQQEWPDAELHVQLPATTSAHDHGVDSSGSACRTALKLPVHRILLSRSAVFKAQVRTEYTKPG